MHYVYHLLDVDVVVYVGRCRRPLSRHQDHERNHQREFRLRIVLGTPDFVEAAARELADIKLLNPPLNVQEGPRSSPGRLGMPHTEETKAKIGNANRGIERTPEWRAKIAATLTGRTQSAETRAKRAEALKARGHKPSEACKEASRAARLGSVASEETRAKMRAAWTRRKAI
jgi:hypothetical protein